MVEVHHDSRACDGERSVCYLPYTLWNGPRDGIKWRRAVRRTVPKVEKVDAKQATCNQPPSVTHSKMGHYSQPGTFTNGEHVFRMIYSRTKYIERKRRDAPHVNRLLARDRWDGYEANAVTRKGARDQRAPSNRPGTIPA